MDKCKWELIESLEFSTSCYNMFDYDYAQPFEPIKYCMYCGKERVITNKDDIENTGDKMIRFKPFDYNTDLIGEVIQSNTEKVHRD